MRARDRAAALLAIALGACAAGAPAASRPAPSPEDPFPHAAAILDRFDAPEPGGDWRVGDSLLYGVRLEGEGASRTWYVLLRLAGDVGSRRVVFEALPGAPSDAAIPPVAQAGRTFRYRFTFSAERSASLDSAGIPVAVHVYDEEGRYLGSSTAEAPERFLRDGFFGPCERGADAVRRANEAMSRPAGAPSDAILRLEDDAAQIFASLMAFLQTFQDAPPLEELRRAIVDEVLDTPSFLSVVFHAGVTLNIHPWLERATAESVAWRGKPDARAYRLPTELGVNGATALRYDLVVLPPDPPLRIGAGVVAMEGAHPNDPTRRFAVHLLGARRLTEAESARLMESAAGAPAAAPAATDP